MCNPYLLFFEGECCRGGGRYRGRVSRLSVLHDGSSTPPCRTAAHTGCLLSTLTKLFKQITLFSRCHIPPGRDLGAGAMTAKTIAALRINLTDRNAWRRQGRLGMIRWHPYVLLSSYRRQAASARHRPATTGSGGDTLAVGNHCRV